jgi:CubicO group peptidase (beta-lactamase class C family)
MSTVSVERLLEETRVRRSGLVVGVALEGGTRLWHRGDLPDGADSVFEIGSVTKTFTSLLLADLARDGVVALDDPVADHLPVAPPVVGRPITLEDLACHHSGLPRLPAGLLWPALTRDRHDPYARLDEAALAAAVRATRPKRPPGKKFGYSNYGAGLLGWALARTAGTTYAALVAERITRPLGLADTWVEVPPAARARVAPGHGWSGGPAGPWDLAALAGAGGLRSTAPDLLRYLAAYADGVGGPLAEAAAETRRLRHRAGRLGTGLGWMVLPGGEGPARFRVAHDVLWHDGGTGGYRSFAATVPDTGASVVVLANQARSVTGLGLKLVRAVAAEDPAGG